MKRFLILAALLLAMIAGLAWLQNEYLPLVESNQPECTDCLGERP